MIGLSDGVGVAGRRVVASPGAVGMTDGTKLGVTIGAGGNTEDMTGMAAIFYQNGVVCRVER